MQWKKRFYRFLDTYSKNDTLRKDLINIEEAIFEKIRIDVEGELNYKWTGSKLENQKADLKIASAIKASFRSYEKQGRRRDGTFFIF